MITSKRLGCILCCILCICVIAGFAIGHISAKAEDATKLHFTVVAGYSVTDQEYDAIKQGFDTFAQGKELGNGGEIENMREILIARKYSSGDSRSLVVYNFTAKNYFLVSNEYYNEYVNGDNFRKLGAPVTEMGTYHLSGTSKTDAIAEGNWQAQIFATGIILTDGSSVRSYVGIVEQTGEGSYVLHPLVDDQDLQVLKDGALQYVGDIDGEMHPLKEAFIQKTEDGYEVYANYSALCAHLSYNADYSLKESGKLIYAGKNFSVEDGAYVAHQLPAECITVSHMVRDGSNYVTTEALAYYQTYQKDGTADSLTQLFEEKYAELYSEGYVAGYRCSPIKMWDLLVLDLRFGDGTTGFDLAGTGMRERMTCLVYNPEQNKVFAVSNAIFLIFKEDSGVGSRCVIGYPETDVLKNKEIDGVVYSEIQLFNNGYIYRTENGNYMGVTGYSYDAENNTLVPTVAPDIPDRYGNEVERKTDGDTVYINYEKGAIACELTHNRSKYIYTYYHGRNFDFSAAPYEAKLLDMEVFITMDSLFCDGAMPVVDGKDVSFEDEIKPLLYKKYRELFKEGYFCGFTEEKFKGAWNNVFAQQFVVSDSTSMIFGEERPNVSALVYNPKTGKVYLMKDDVIKTWQAYYATAGSPTSDEYQVEGCDYYFQTFDFGMTIRKGALIVFTEEFASPEEYVQLMKDNQLSAPTHNKDQADGYIG